MSQVSIVRCRDYQAELVSAAVKQSLDLLGGLEAIIQPRAKVFVKINSLSPPSPPEKGIITHPFLTAEVLKLLQELDCEVTVGDDIQAETEDGFLISGYRQICDKLGVNLVNLKETGFRQVRVDGAVLKKVYIAKPVLDADFIVNLPKLKTHSFTIFTGAVKNMYGIIPLGFRLQYHHDYIKNEIFSQMLVDIFLCARPHLTVMDGIVAMEGEGPAAGRLKKTGLILASRDGVALDAAASKIAGFRPLDIFTTFFAHQRGLGFGDLSGIEILGEKIQHVRIPDFRHSILAVALLRRKLPAALYGFINDQLILSPEVAADRCTACLECVKICPAGAARSREGKAWIDPGKCIHCMCCHEVCRFQAVILKQKPMGRVIRGFSAFGKNVKSLFLARLK